MKKLFMFILANLLAITIAHADITVSNSVNAPLLVTVGGESHLISPNSSLKLQRSSQSQGLVLVESRMPWACKRISHNAMVSDGTAIILRGHLLNNCEDDTSVLHWFGDILKHGFSENDYSIQSLGK